MYKLSADDVELLRDMAEAYRNRVENGEGYSWELQDSTSPDVYMAIGAVPAGTVAGGVGDVPGTADIDVFQLVNGVVAATGNTVTVYNYGSAIPDDTWYQVNRDKYGTWTVVPPSTSSAPALVYDETFGVTGLALGVPLQVVPGIGFSIPGPGTYYFNMEIGTFIKNIDLLFPPYQATPTIDLYDSTNGLIMMQEEYLYSIIAATTVYRKDPVSAFYVAPAGTYPATVQVRMRNINAGNTQIQACYGPSVFSIGGKNINAVPPSKGIMLRVA